MHRINHHIPSYIIFFSPSQLVWMSRESYNPTASCYYPTQLPIITQGGRRARARTLLTQTDRQRLCGNIKCKTALTAERRDLTAKPILSLKFLVLSFGLFPSMDPQLGCLRHSKEVIRDKINRSITLVQSPPPVHSIQDQIILRLTLCRQQVIIGEC